MYGIYERYTSPAVFTRDQDQSPDPGVLAELARRISNIEMAIRILAEGDGEEGQVDDGGAVTQATSGPVPGISSPNDRTPKHPVDVGDRRRPTTDRALLAAKVGPYNRRLTANTNSVIASINQRNKAAYDPRSGQLAR